MRSTGVYSVKFFHLLSGTCGLGLLTRNWKFYSASDLDGTIRVRRMAEIQGNIMYRNAITQVLIGIRVADQCLVIRSFDTEG